MKGRVNFELPKNTHDQDIEWVSDRLRLLSLQIRHRAVVGYDMVFEEHYTKERIPHKQQNAARRAANVRLRLFVNEFYKAAMGVCAPPPEEKGYCFIG